MSFYGNIFYNKDYFKEQNAIASYGNIFLFFFKKGIDKLFLMCYNGVNKGADGAVKHCCLTYCDRILQISEESRQ